MKDRYFEIYKITNSVAAKIVRGALFVVSIIFVYFRYSSHLDVVVPLSIFSFVVINELFLESLNKIHPENKVSKNIVNPLLSTVFSARKTLQESNNGFEVVKKIERGRDVKFFSGKLDSLEIKTSKINIEDLLKQAQELCVWIKGQYITEVDLYAAYILLTEEETHFMQANKLTNDDVINILYWTRRKFSPDVFENEQLRFIGGGVFDNLIYGWNYELKKYSKDLTWEVLSKRFPPNIIGAEKAYKELVVGLSKHKSSNVIVVGEAGVGKESLVEYFAYSSFMKQTPPALFKKQVYELYADRILSGVTGAGDLEMRLSAVLSEISYSGNAIIFIRNIENIFGGGGLGFDITGVIEEYLASDSIKIIGTTTPQGYANFIEPKTSVLNLFEKVEIEEPESGKVMLLLTEKAREIEAQYGIQIKYSALKESVILSPTYFPEEFYPGRALNLLEGVASFAEVGRKKVIDGSDVIKFVEEKTNIALAEPNEKEKELLIHLEEKIHQRVVGQEQAVGAISDAMRRARSGFEEKNRPISVFLFLGPTGVGKTETAKALAEEYFGREGAMIRLDMSEYQTQDKIDKILGSKTGQEYVANTLPELIEKQPFSLVLLDEFEKANPSLLNIFLQVFDEGFLTNNHGKKVSFKNAIIIATSNAGTELLREKEQNSQNVTKKELVDYLLRNNLFSPELVNRFDDVIVFRFLTQDEVKQIAQLMLGESFKKLLEDHQIKISFDETVTSKIAEDAYNPEFGARNIRRYIEDSIESFLSKKILGGEVNKGSEVMLSVDSTGEFVVT